MTLNIDSQENSRWQEIVEIWKHNQWLFILAGWLLGLITFPAIQQFENIQILLANLLPEAIGITFTILVLDRLAENRAREQLKTRLFREAKGQANNTAIAAIDWMREEGWLFGEESLLKGKLLYDANLENADLSDANLQNALLQNVNLNGANLAGANLSYSSSQFANIYNASCMFCNLSYSYMMGAKLRNSIFYAADFQGAYLLQADLTDAKVAGVNFLGAFLAFANLSGVEFVQDVFGASIMPDGTIWSEETDITRFTDILHPQFNETLEKINSIREEHLGIPRIVVSKEQSTIRIN